MEMNDFSYPDDEVCGDPDCWCADDSIDPMGGSIFGAIAAKGAGTLNKLTSEEQKMSDAAVGTQVRTSNSVINSLPVGAILEVLHVDGQGNAELEVIDVVEGGTASFGETDTPTTATSFKPGDRINTKHGAATVVRPSMWLDVTMADGQDLDGYLLYVADSDPVLRRERVERVSAL